MKKRIDIHCHLFNRKELSLLMIFDIIQLIRRAELVLSKLADENDENDAEAKQLTRSVKSSVSFFFTVMKTPKKIFQTIQNAEVGFLFVPLMLDLYWLSQSPKPEVATMKKKRRVARIISYELDKLIQSFHGMASQKDLSIGRRKMLFELKRLTQVMYRAYDHKYKLSPGLKTMLTDYYPKQEKQIEELYQQYSDEMYPFFAIDPRRTSNYSVENGVYNLKPLTDRLKINGGIFSGFKLYAPCGYSPTHPMLMALYDYCEKYRVPIIAHCSGSGVTTISNDLLLEGHVYKDGELVPVNGIWSFEHREVFNRNRILEHSERLNHPMLWEYVLDRFPNLCIDLAHFGHLPHTSEWTDYIYMMLKKCDEKGNYLYPNLYTDLACIPETSTLKDMRERYFLQHGELRSRFLYGSDFYMNLIYLSDMSEYLDNFQQIFTPEEFDLISIENPRRFLGIE